MARTKHTLATCIESAAEFATKRAWKKYAYNVYFAAVRNGWVDKCCEHMTPVRQYLTRDEVIESASHHHNRKSWRYHDPNGYAAAARQGLLNDYEVVGHMVARWTRD